MKTVSASELYERFVHGDDLHLIDVLPPGSFGKKHLPGAVNVSFYDERFLDRIETVVEDRDALVVVYCHRRSCNASREAATVLAQEGYTNVLDFEGGVQEWEDEGFPLQGSRSS